jgi:ankyrin repeat protein
VLLDACRAVDSTTDAYVAWSTALELVATSAHPRIAGVQIPLIDLLLARGAAIDGVNPGASTVASALANGCPEAARALVERGARVPNVAIAAGATRFDLVKQLVGPATKAELEKALVLAARYGSMEVVEYLLDRGVDIGASDGLTALHDAAGRADLEMTKMLIRRGAPLEKENSFGGTVLDSTLWFAYNTSPFDRAGRDYPAVIDILIAAGAKADLYPEMKGYIDEIYRRAGRQRG